MRKGSNGDTSSESETICSEIPMKTDKSASASVMNPVALFDSTTPTTAMTQQQHISPGNPR